MGGGPSASTQSRVEGEGRGRPPAVRGTVWTIPQTGHPSDGPIAQMGRQVPAGEPAESQPHCPETQARP